MMNMNIKANRLIGWATTALLVIASLCMFTACPRSTDSVVPAVDKFTVAFSVDGGNGTLIAKVDDAKIDTGAKVEKGKTVTFTAAPASHYKIEGWTLNGKAVNGTSETYTLTVAEVADVRVKFASTGSTAKVLITYNTENLTVTYKKSDRYELLASNSEVSEGTLLRFTGKNIPEGQQVDKWMVNTKAIDNNDYTVNAADAVVNDSQKVIAVTYTLKTAEPVVMRFDESEIRVYKSGSGRIRNGDTVYEGNRLWFELTDPPDGQQVDKWKVNTKELRGNVYRVNAADAVSEGSQQVITITYTTKPAAQIVVRFNESEIKVHKDGGGTIANGEAVYEERGIWFSAISLPAGQQVDKWKVNTKELDGDGYMVNAADAVSEGSEQVITITYTTKPAAQIVVRFNESEIKVRKDGDGTIANDEAVYEGKRISFQVKNLPDGQQVDKWKVNTKELSGNVYIVNAADAVSEGSQQVITITYTTKPAAQIVVRFNESEIKVRKDGGGTIANGEAVYEERGIWFSAISLPAGLQVDKWKVNSSEINGNRYRINAADAVSEGSQQVITITYTTKPAAQIIVKFNESQIEVHNNENSAETISDGQAIYEGKSIFFKVKNLAAGQQFDMWKVNTKGLNGNVYTVNAADAVTEGSQQVITIMYTTKPGTDPVIIKFDSTVTWVHYRTADMSITNGQTVYADTELYLSKQKHVSDTVNKWLINTKEYAANKDIVYKVNPRDAIEENGQKVIRISFTVTATQTLTVKFDPDLIECKTVSNRIIESDEDCPPYTYAIFKALASDPQVKYWEINDKKISKSEGLVILEKQIDPAVAVDEGGKKVVKVNLVFE